jgi:hypothetical protein
MEVCVYGSVTSQKKQTPNFCAKKQTPNFRGAECRRTNAAPRILRNQPEAAPVRV